MSSSAWSSDVCSRSEEHTSELQSHDNLVCRLLLEQNDVIVASDRARFGMFVVKVGLVPELASTHFLVQRIGFALAIFFFLIAGRPRAYAPFPTGPPFR